MYRRTWIAVFVIAALAGLALFTLFQLYRELPSKAEDDKAPAEGPP